MIDTETVAALAAMLRATAKGFADLADQTEAATEETPTICVWCGDNTIVMTKDNRDESLAAMRAHQLACEKNPTAALLAACEMLVDDPGLTASANEVVKAAVAKARG